MKSTNANSLLVAAAACVLLGALPAKALIVSLNPVADTFITAATQNGASPTSNYGSLGAMTVAGSASGNGGEYLALLMFDLSSALNQFNSQFGSGNWSISGATLQLNANFGTQGAQPNNLRFPPINGGLFAIDWFADDSWTETGVTYNNFSPGGTEGLGSYTYVPPGNDVPVVWMLGLEPSFVSDVSAGSSVSLRLSPGDATVSYLFNTRTYNTAANFPVLSVTAVPEPSSLALGALAGAGLWALRRFRAA